MYLITGGTGQIGAYVVRRLATAGEELVLFDLRADTELLRLVCGTEVSRQVKIIEGDLSSPTELISAASRFRPKAIIHLASLLPPTAERDAHTSLTQITGGMINVLEAARIVGSSKVVWASATSVFGRPSSHGGPDVSVSDDAPHAPTSLYGITKSANERLVALYRERHGVDSIGFRFCQGYGPGKRRGRPYGYQLFEAAVRGLPCTVPYGDDIINWQYIEDIADIIVRGTSTSYRGVNVYNTTGEVVRMVDAIGVLSSLVPKLDVTLSPGTADIVWRYDARRLASDIGFDNPTRIAHGFAQTLEIMRAWDVGEAR